MNNIAIYSRKSKFTGKGESIENQMLRCKKYIEFKFEINPDDVDIYIDEGFSGKNENRPSYKEMINKVKTGEIKHIVLYQLNRFGRNARDIHNSLQVCTDHDCVIYSAQEGFDSKTSFGRAIIGIMASLAQLETEQLGERVKENMYTLAKMGRWLGGQSPLGFDGSREYYIDIDGKERSVTKLQKNNEELKLVQSIYNKYLEEESLSQVGKWSLSNNFKGKNGGNLDKSAINIILQNPVYVKSNNKVTEYLKTKDYDVCGEANGNGMLRYGKEEPVIAVSNHKGVIDADKWLEVQRILKDNTLKAPRLGKTNTALLTGILKCSCGSNMRVTYGKVKKDGIKPFYYTCNMKNASGGSRCTSKNINGHKIEEHLINYLKIYSKDIILTELQSLYNDSKKLDLSSSLNSIDIDIEKSNKAIKQLLNKLKIIEDDNDLVSIILDEIKHEKNTVKSLELKKASVLNDEGELSLSQSDIFDVCNTLNTFNESYDFLSFEERKKRLNLLLDTILYDGNNFNIKLNIKKKLDNCINALSSLYTKYNLSQLRPSHLCMMFQIEININTLLYCNLPSTTFAERFKKAKLLQGISQMELSELTGLSRSTINDLESGRRYVLQRDTLLNLTKYLDENVLCDTYHMYVLYQGSHISSLINLYGISMLSNALKVHHSTLYRWRDCKYTLPFDKYKIIIGMNKRE